MRINALFAGHAVLGTALNVYLGMYGLAAVFGVFALLYGVMAVRAVRTTGDV